METVTIELKKYEYLISCKEAMDEIETDTNKLIVLIEYNGVMKKYLLRNYQKEFINIKEISNEYENRWRESESKLNKLQKKYDEKCKICKLLKLNTK